MLTGQRLTEKVILSAAERAASMITPLEDIQTPVDYRRHLVGTSVRRALEATRDSGNGQ